MCVKLKVNVQTEIFSFENDSEAYSERSFRFVPGVQK